MRGVLVIKSGERQAKIGAKLLEGQLRSVGLGKNVICRAPDGGEVVHEGSGPVEDDVADHG